MTHPAELMRRLYWQRKRAGLCPKCGGTPRKDRVLCSNCGKSKHVVKGARKCSTCGERGHNRQTCTRSEVLT